MKLKELLKHYRVPYKDYGTHHHSTLNWIQVDCPYCSSRSGKFRLGICLNAPAANCWGCGPHRVLEVLQDLTKEELWVLKRFLGDAFTQRGKTKLRGELKLPEGVGDLLPAHESYLVKRGFNLEEIKTLWKVRGIGVATRLPWSILLPVTYQGEVVSWCTRSISDELEKRYNAARPEEERLPLKSLLYGMDLVRHTIVVVEGPLDVWAIGPGAVATFGVNYTRSQMLKISRFPKRYICFDKEPEAQKRARRLCKSLSPFPGKTLRVALETGKDPPEASMEERRALRRLIDPEALQRV